MAIANSFHQVSLIWFLVCLVPLSVQNQALTGNLQFCLGLSAVDPLEALRGSHGMAFRFDTTLGRFDEAYVDRLELRAATRALLNLQHNGTPIAVPDPSGPAEASQVTEQLNQARASILSLKAQLYRDDGQTLHDLLSNETNTAADRIKACADASNGSFTGGWVTIEVTGKISTPLDIYSSFGAMFSISDDMPPSAAENFTKDFFFPVHPEHYQILSTDGIGITETWGGIPTSTYLDALALPPSYVLEKRDLSYDIGIAARGYLGDAEKTTVTWILQQWRQTTYGLELNMWFWYPAACPPEYIHDQAEHLCVEYRNGLHLLAAYYGF